MDQTKNDILQFLKTNSVMTLAVSENNIPWACTLYYSITDDFIMYVVSDPNSRHGKVLNVNNNISFNVFDSHTRITEPKKGVQGIGKYFLITNLKEMLIGLKMWHDANPGIESKITLDDLKKLPDTRLYKIKIDYAKFFNKTLYPDTEFKDIKI